MGGIGADGIEFRDDGEPTVILMAGLQGVGKTTACGKLALALRKQGKSVLMVATDVYRPAAIDQLKTLGTQIGVPVFDMGVDGNPPEIAARGVRKAKDEDIDVVIVDTAGRLNIDEKLMGELKATKMATNADETLLVVDAMTGQEAATLTASFNDAVEITGAILTKMDGDTRGGAALSVREVSGKPIKFTGVGEKMDALEPFYPERMTSRILGMGDIVSLVEKVQAGVAEEEALKIQEKIMNATFDFNDFVNQLEMMNNMGSMKQLMQMMPGTAKLSDADMEAAEKSMTIAKSLINSMTKEERQYPDMLVASTNAESRRARIIKGSGRKEADLANLIIMFGGMRTKMQQMSGQLGGKAASVGLTPQLSEAELTKLAMNKVRKTIKPGFVRRPKAKKVPKFLSERVEIEGKA
jgi:signal recognition particle subunit SRP54